jgi:FemAB-related protein (PEP-CTERM system-associated)
LNYGGVCAENKQVAGQLIDRAVQLATELNVRYLELRHERAVEHASLQHRAAAKVNMRLMLPENSGVLWDQLSSKVRNQIRKAGKSGLTTVWGGQELLAEFYHVFSRNMRDLGTPVFSRKLFRAILQAFPDRAEICSVRLDSVPVAAALLLHGWQVTEVPSASSLREHNHTCANMQMYWQLLERAIQRKQKIFDFGRCTPEGNTFRFKRQWGAQPASTSWQYYVRKGAVGEHNPHSQR